MCIRDRLWLPGVIDPLKPQRPGDRTELSIKRHIDLVALCHPLRRDRGLGGCWHGTCLDHAKAHEEDDCQVASHTRGSLMNSADVGIVGSVPSVSPAHNGTIIGISAAITGSCTITGPSQAARVP